MRAAVVVRPSTSKAELALRKKNERANTTALLATLELLAPNVEENKRQPGYRSKALRGRAKEELLADVMHAVRLARRLMGPGGHESPCCTLEDAYTTQAGAGLIAIELKSGKIAHQSPSFQLLNSWIPIEARGNIRVSLEARDGDDFHSFCQSVVRDAGESFGETFLDRDKVVGWSITVRFLTRAPGPPGLRNPEWLLMERAVKLTLVGVQPRQLAEQLPAAGRRMPLWGQARIPKAIGVFTADLRGGTPQQWTLQVAHIRNLLDLEVASGTYDSDTGDQKPLEQIATFFGFEFSKEEGGGASLFSRAVAIAQRSASWLTRNALSITYKWEAELNDDDTLAVSVLGLYKLFGGLSTSVSLNFVGGKVGFSHGGLDFLYLVANPAQPLDSNLRGTLVRIASAKTPGEFNVHSPFVLAFTWGEAFSLNPSP